MGLMSQFFQTIPINHPIRRIGGGIFLCDWIAHTEEILTYLETLPLGPEIEETATTTAKPGRNLEILNSYLSGEINRVIAQTHDITPHRVALIADKLCQSFLQGILESHPANPSASGIKSFPTH